MFVSTAITACVEMLEVLGGLKAVREMAGNWQ